MKKNIFLTEEQIKYIQDNNQMLNEGFLKNYYKDCETFEDYYKMTMVLLAMGIGTVSSAIVLMQNVFPKETENNIKEMKVDFVKSAEKNNENTADFNKERDSIRTQKVSEINNLMKYVAELNGKNPKDIKLSAEHIVDMCDKHNFYLPLLLAQAHIESHFGTTPRAIKTNSVFSVGSYDDGRNVYKPNSQNESVENYILTLKNYYLNDKTMDELLSKNGFVNHNGHRYASDKNYELKIRQTMNGLIKKFCPSCF